MLRWTAHLLLGVALGCGGPAVGPAVGQRAPTVSLPVVGGGAVASIGDEGPALLVFWASWCGPCRAEAPAVAALATARSGRLRVQHVNLGEPGHVADRAAAELGIAPPVLLDPDGAAMRAYAVDALPLHVLIDGEGVVRHRGPTLPPDSLLDGVSG
jgi:cytochrome c biogenesis protein CcmG/thiol:disulfide interchange protein DsbE